jgi:hypothetical protein
MKAKHLIIVSLLLAIMAIGAVSASEDIASDDGMAASDGEVSETPIGDVSSDDDVLEESPYEENGFDPIVQTVADLDEEEPEPVVDINAPDEGNFSIIVEDDYGEVNTFNHVIDDDDLKEGYVVWDLDDLEITEVGIYKLSAKFINTDSSWEWVFQDHRLIVTEGSMVTFADEEFDIRDSETPIVSIYCPDELTGVFLVKVFEEDDEDWAYLDQASHVIDDSDYEDYVNFTMADFNVEIKAGSLYKFRVYLLNDETDEANDNLNKIASEELEAFDSTEFRAKFNGEIFHNGGVVLTNNNPIVYVYCPDGSEGKVTVSVRKGDEGELAPFSKDVSQADENWLVWNIVDLGMNSIDEYFITVEANDTILEKGVRVEVYNPIAITEGVSYIGGDDLGRSNIAEVQTSSDIADGRIVITLNGEEIFNMTLSEFSDDGDEDTPFWFHPSHGPGDSDEDIKIYSISNKDVNYDFEENAYELTVSLFIDGYDEINRTREVQFVNAKSKSEDGVTITIYDYGEYTFDEDWPTVVDITAPEDADGVIIITVDGSYYDEIPLSDFEDGGYSIGVGDFEDAGPGYHVVTVAYWNNDEEIFNVTGNIKIDVSPRISISGWGAITVHCDEIIRIDPNADDCEDFRVVLMIGDEVYLNSTKKELGLTFSRDDEGDLYYRINNDMLDKAFCIGQHYDDVVAYYYSDKFEVNSMHDGPASLYIDGMLEEVEYNYTGAVISVFFAEDDGEIRIFIEGRDDPVVYTIQDGDKDTFINFDLAQLGLELGFDGNIDVEYGYDQFGGHLSVVNNSEFRVKTKDTLILFRDVPVLLVYCPQGSAGKTISLYGEGNDFASEYVIEDNDQGSYVGFTLDNLEIAENGWYEFNVTVDGEQIGDNFYGFDVKAVIYINQNGIATLPEGDEITDTMGVIGLNLPNDFEGNVVITIDGNTVFDDDLSEIDSDEWDGFMHYVIYTSDLEGISEGEYTIVVNVGDDFSQTGSIMFTKRNYVSEGNVSIEMIPLDITYSDGDWDSYWDTYFAIVTNCERTFNLAVFLENRGYHIEINDDVWIDEIWDNDEIVGYKYYIRVGDIKNDGENSNIWGKYNVTVVFYDENGDVFLTNNDTLTVTKMPDIRVCFTGDWNERIAEYWLNRNDDVINIHYYDENLDLDDIVVVLTSGDEILFNGTLGSLNPEVTPEDDGCYNAHITINQINIPTGHYDDVLATLYMGDYQARSDIYEDSCTSFDVYWGYVDFHIIEPVTSTDSGNLVDIYAPVDADGNIVVTIGDESYFEGRLKGLGEIYQFDEDVQNNAGHYYFGIANFTTPVLPGHYNLVVISYVGDDGFLTDNTKSWDPVDSIDVYGNSSVTFSHNNIVYVYGDAGNTTITVVGATVSEADIGVDDHPEAEIHLVDDVITVTNLTVGQYTLRVTTTPINEYYNSVDATARIWVNEEKVNPNFTISIDDAEEGEPIVVTVTANETFTGDVIIMVNNNKILVSVKDGRGYNGTTGVVLAAGVDYDVTLDYGGNGGFNASHVETKLNVTAKSGEGNATPSEGGNATPSGSGSSQRGQGTASQPAAQTQAPVNDIIKLTLKKVKVKKSAKKLVLRATLKINGKKVKGKIVRFKFNGKTYKAKTNKKGIAKVTIKKAVLKKLKVGKKIKYQVSYGGKTVKKTVKVKK